MKHNRRASVGRPWVGVLACIDPRIRTVQRIPADLDVMAGQPADTDSFLNDAIRERYGSAGTVLAIYVPTAPAVIRQLDALLTWPRDPTISAEALEEIAELAPDVELLELRDDTLRTIERERS
jgi:hypothetical protein